MRSIRLIHHGLIVLLAAVTLAGGTAQADTLEIELTGFEVTQGIQNLANEMPLVADRRTVVRAYVKGISREHCCADAVLWAYKKGPFPGSWSGFNPGGIGAENQQLTIKASGGNRLELNDSFWFMLPRRWLSSGTVRFELHVNVDDDGVDLNPSAEFTFEEGSPADLVAVPIELYKDGDETTSAKVYRATESDFSVIASGIYRFHPVANVNWDTERPTLTPSKAWDLRDLDNHPRLVADIHNSRDYFDKRHYVGMVHPEIDVGVGVGIGEVGYSWWSGHDLWSKMDGAAEAGLPTWHIPGATTLAHELGHNERLSHMNCAGFEHEGGPVDTNYPYPHPLCSLAAADPAGYFGFDVYYRNFGLSEPAILSNDRLAPEIHRAFPFMGYKEPNWVSPYEYRLLLDRYLVSKKRSANTLHSPEEAARAEDLRAASSYLEVSGLADRRAPPRAEILRVDRWDRLDEAVVEAAIRRRLDRSARGGSSGYELVLANQDNDVLYSMPLRLDGPGLVPFSELMPWVRDTTRVQIRRVARVVAERWSSPQAPVVRVTEPAPGTELKAGTRIAWTASDPDGDVLRAEILYSPDGGASWRVIKTEVVGSAYNLRASDHLPASSQGTVRVVVNDGFHTATADGPGFVTVASGAPRATILSPRHGTEVPMGRVVILHGLASDKDDGPLSGDSLTWSSDRDGDLGHGEEVHVRHLSQGWHNLTLTATDAHGAVARAGVGMEVVAPAVSGTEPGPCPFGLSIRHPDPTYVGIYEVTSERINDAPVYSRGNYYMYRHAVAFTSSGFVWVIQPVIPDPVQWLANAYGEGETPWEATWNVPAIKVQCLKEPLPAPCPGGLEVTHPDATYGGIYRVTSERINDAPVYERGNYYIYRHAVAFTSSGFVWVVQPVAPDPAQWLANAYGEGETPWEAQWGTEIGVRCRP